MKKNGFAGVLSLMTLLLFAVFALFALLTILFGADTYRHMHERVRHTNDARTAAMYFTTRLRQADTADNFYIEDFEGCNALVLAETIEETVYETRLYNNNGYLHELFAAADSTLHPSDGTPLIPINDVVFSIDGNKLNIGITTVEGDTRELQLTKRSKGGWYS